MDRLDAPDGKYVPVTIMLGATDNIKRAIAKTRADIRNRLNFFEGGNAYLNRFSHRTERWMWVAKDSENYIFHLDSVRDGTLNLTKDIRNNSLGKNPTDYWYFDRVVGGLNPSKDRTPHPAQFPVEMIERIIRASSNPGDVVLDPFSGSGTTVIAAWQNGRKGIGIEVDPRYHKIANKRLDEVRRKSGMEPPPALEKLAS